MKERDMIMFVSYDDLVERKSLGMFWQKRIVLLLEGNSWEGETERDPEQTRRGNEQELLIYPLYELE